MLLKVGDIPATCAVTCVIQLGTLETCTLFEDTPKKVASGKQMPRCKLKGPQTKMEKRVQAENRLGFINSGTCVNHPCTGQVLQE